MPVWWHIPLIPTVQVGTRHGGALISFIPALGRHRQGHFCEFRANLVYKVISKTDRATQKNPVSKQHKNKTTKGERPSLKKKFC